MLMHAAHETSLEYVRHSPIMTPYGADFGRRRGDFGVVAELTDNGQPVKAGWFRLLKGQGGFAVLVSDDDDIPELALAVLPEHEGRGIATRILQKLLEEADERNLRGVCLTCRTNNSAALHLYRKFGFEVLPNTEVVNRTGGTSVTMIRMFR